MQVLSLITALRLGTVGDRPQPGVPTGNRTLQMSASVMVLGLRRVRPGVPIALGLLIPAAEDVKSAIDIDGSPHLESLLQPPADSLKGFKRLFCGKPGGKEERNKEGKDPGWLV